MNTMIGKQYRIIGIIGMLVLFGMLSVLSGCGVSSPTKDEAVRQMTTYIRTFTWHNDWSGRNEAFSERAQLQSLSVMDTRQINATTAEVIFVAQYNALENLNVTFTGSGVAALTANQGLNKGMVTNVQIATIFQKFDNRGWVLTKVGQ